MPCTARADKPRTPKPPIEARILYSPAELSIATGISVPMLEVHRNRGTGPKWFRLGRLIKYHRDDVSAWLASQGGRL